MNHSTSDKSLGYGFLFMPPIMPQLGQMCNLYITLQTPSNKGFHPTPLARLVSGGHTRFVVGLVLKVVSPQSRRG